MDEDSEDWILRRTTDYQFVEHVVRLETRIEQLETADQRLSVEMEELKTLVLKTMQSVDKTVEMQANYQPTLHSIDRVLGAGLVLRWIVLFVIGTLAAVGTVATAWDTVRGWIR